ncbi:Uncharacterised protein [Citrobacter werkmanii]|uniref:Uncharacterized protein n=1 Tax=Citrobacter werkmanii TaxID=67827 RepID=A0A9N8CR67_9ENTR|nr:MULTISPECIES: hypothetical protein [Citrobacter freundii complex]EGT0641182.1 hypothetical protein [Citrobacter werkmanii]CAB5555239.1 Uncharacterised protein [Citrobacter werkmanii]CAB5563452.1 Uncharacterised protein [Citrobacter werkmanii]CAB5582712.1 Uncharacterised protein [Citrobacter werkmanii]CAB5588366.1 Uncharacterised protein [Citrobacter werkmanii]
MKFSELPEAIQGQAAKALANELQGLITWDDDKRTEKAKAIAESVRESYVTLCSES